MYQKLAELKKRLKFLIFFKVTIKHMKYKINKCLNKKINPKTKTKLSSSHINKGYDIPSLIKSGSNLAP